jgi:hypothetical protein
MDPMTLGLLLNTGGLIASQIGGNRPKYEIPDSAKQALGQARLLAYDQSAPGESRKMDAARLSSANAVRAAQEGGNALEAVAGIQGQENRAVQGILADSEMAQRKDMDDYMNLLLQMGNKEDMAFQMNEFAPYADKQNEMRDILGGMTQNLYNLSEKERLMKLLGGESTPDAVQTPAKPDRQLCPLPLRWRWRARHRLHAQSDAPPVPRSPATIQRHAPLYPCPHPQHGLSRH